ncbi:MAG: hypothetical protein PHX30_04275 [Candidatus Pacebacteria bacterium]|jgi:hypothetical protein|nr:hypothetical protein [Candidatus Paceibacterota bacterium]
MSEEKTGQSNYSSLWTTVTKELEKGDMSANKVAVLESKKIFQKALDDKNLPGKNTDDKIKNYANLFSNSDKLKYARAMCKKIVTNIGFDISTEDTREIIKGYREGIVDLEKTDFKSWSIKDKISLFLKRNFYSFPKKSKQLIAILLTFSVLTFVLSETETGRELSRNLVEINNYFFYKIIPMIGIIVVSGLIILGALYVYQNKKK